GFEPEAFLLVAAGAGTAALPLVFPATAFWAAGTDAGGLLGDLDARIFPTGTAGAREAALAAVFKDRGFETGEDEEPLPAGPDLDGFLPEAGRD
ncbi:MAG: hypothetical protein LBQ79_12690, partial [Deltaproteobacteria bacterium]|nr:hypothetical protein [Deltaproteobacteria bacterium]